MDTISSPYGLWVNKRAVATLGLSFIHTLTADGAGWHLSVEANGQVFVRFRDGESVTIAVEVGDHVLSSGDEIYFALQRPPGGPLDDEPEEGKRPHEHEAPVHRASAQRRRPEHKKEAP